MALTEEQKRGCLSTAVDIIKAQGKSGALAGELQSVYLRLCQLEEDTGKE